jgi:hypothetical protein
MDDKDGYFQDLSNTILDIEIGNIIGNEKIEYGDEFITYYRPVITQDVEVKYYKNGVLINTEIGYFYTHKRSRKIDLYTRRKGIENKYSFGIEISE